MKFLEKVLFLIAGLFILIILAVLSVDIIAGQNFYAWKSSETSKTTTQANSVTTASATEINTTKAADSVTEEIPSITSSATVTAPVTTQTAATGLSSTTTVEDLTQSEINNGNTVTLRFGGDVSLSEGLSDYTEKSGFEYPFGSISELMSSADIAFFNLETSVSERGASVKPSGFGFRTDPKFLRIFSEAGVDFVGLANNHAIDYGFDALGDTLANLTSAGIQYTGLGQNIEGASALAVIEKNSIKVGFLAFTQIIPFSSWRASEENAGVNPLVTDADYKYAETVIKNAKLNCDILIVNVHFGTEYTHTANKNQINTAHFLADCGADAVVGHHPHYLQGIEFYNGVPVFYSTGNLLFYKYNEEAAKSAVFEIVMSREGFISGKLYPTVQSGAKPYKKSVSSREGADIIKIMNDASEPFGVSVDASDGSFGPAVISEVVPTTHRDN